MKLRDDFAQEDENALYTALLELGNDWARRNEVEPTDSSVYDYLDETPKTSLTLELIEKLSELGYSIVPSHQKGE